MPTNDYICPKCLEVTSITSSFKELNNYTCPKCKIPLEWKPQPVPFILKGSGWTGKGS